MKVKYKFFLIFTFLIVTLGAFLGASTINVSAAGNSSINRLYMNEKTSIVNHSKNSTNNNTYYVDEKIQIYSGSNNGNIVSNDTIYIDSNNIYIDYTTGNGIAYHPVSSSNDYTDTYYRFEILDSTNTVKWFSEFNMSTYDKWAWFVTTTHYVKEVKVNGTTKTTDTTTKSDAWLVLTEFGKNSLYLSDGTYKLNLSRKYDWHKDGVNYSSTANATGTLCIDTSKPTISMVGENNQTISNNAYVNSKVKVSYSDKNGVNGYVKYPNSTTNYYFTSNSSFGGTTGYYEFYARDNSGNTSSTLKFYYDGIKPTGKFYSNGVEVSDNSYVKGSFSYLASDGESGIKDIYYLAPNAKEYIKYSNNTLIPDTYGDGWYSFYCVDKANNVSAISKIFLEVTKPTFQITRNGEVALSEVIASNTTHDIYINEDDVLNINYSSSSNVVNSNYPLNKDITFSKQDYPLNKYEITLNTPTGFEVVINVHIVRVKPHVVIDGKSYYDGSKFYFNNNIDLDYVFDETILNHLDTKISIQDSFNNSFTVTNFKNTLKAVKDEEVTYTISLSDPSNNKATISVVINKIAPIATWISDGKVMANDAITNKAAYLDFNNEDGKVKAVYTLDHLTYKDYNKQKFTSDGTYYVILTDISGNSITYKSL